MGICYVIIVDWSKNAQYLVTSFESTDKFKIYFLAANEGPVEFLGVGRNFLGGSAKEVCALAARWVFPANRQLTQFPQDGQIGQPPPPLHLNRLTFELQV